MINEIHIKIPKNKIAFLIKIIEGYDNLAVVTTIEPKEGLVVVRVTPDTADDILDVLKNIPYIEFR